MTRLTDAIADLSPNAAAEVVLALYKEIWAESASCSLRPGARVKRALVAAGFDAADAKGLKLTPRTTAAQIVERLRRN